MSIPGPNNWEVTQRRKVQALEDRVEELEAVLRELDDWMRAYPEDIFSQIPEKIRLALRGGTEA